MKEELEPLPQAPEERIISGDETKVFQIKSTILYLDNKAGGMSYEGAEVIFENPVTVINSENQIIGYGTLNVDGKRVEVELFLNYHTPERLLIETKSSPLWLHFDAKEALDNSKGNWVVAATNIERLAILNTPPLDERLDSL